MDSHTELIKQEASATRQETRRDGVWMFFGPMVGTYLTLPYHRIVN